MSIVYELAGEKKSENTTTKPSTGSTNSSSNNSGATNTGTTTKPSEPVHEHTWTEVTVKM